jgi:hypothetical protein
MSMRKGLLGLAGMIGVTGLAAGVPEPPINPHVEGRELNPVVREFYESEKPVQGYSPGPVILNSSTVDPDAETAGFVAVVADTWDLLLDRLTIPMGRAEAKEGVSGEGM